jgi:CubicO group peptidase (beta-lactamase class C family)
MRAAWAALMLVGAGCSHPQPKEVGDGLAAAVRETVEEEDAVRNAVLLVDAPRLGLSGTWASGMADARTQRALTADTPVLSASVGKLFTAAAVLVLHEKGVLSVSDPVTRWVAPEVLQGLPVEGGDAAFSKVTLAHLLSHRSGLPDYFEGSPARDGAPTVLQLLEAEPERTWSAKQLLDYTREHFGPAGRPGERFLYADTNYDLLGLVLEAAAGKPFHEVVRTEVIEPLGLRHTWYHSLGTPPAGVPSLADAWIGDFNATGRNSLTADQAGGGLATTVEDLRVFMRALATGRLVPWASFQKDWTQDAMASGIDYAYGLWRIRPGGVFFLLGQLPELLGASGATGSFVYYIPEYDAVVAGTFNQTRWAEDHVRFLLRDVLPKLARLKPVAPAGQAR